MDYVVCSCLFRQLVQRFQIACRRINKWNTGSRVLEVVAYPGHLLYTELAHHRSERHGNYLKESSVHQGRRQLELEHQMHR